MKSYKHFMETYADLKARVLSKQAGDLESIKAGSSAELERRKNEVEAKKEREKDRISRLKGDRPEYGPMDMEQPKLSTLKY